MPLTYRDLKNRRYQEPTRILQNQDEPVASVGDEETIVPEIRDILCIYALVSDNIELIRIVIFRLVEEGARS